MESITYLGIDFHKRTSTLCFMNEKGGDIEMVNIHTKNLNKFLANRKNLLIGIEASGGTNDAAEKLKLSGHDVRIVNPNKLGLVGQGGKKTDEKDARAIADCLRLNFVCEVHHKSRRARELKSLVVGREMLVRSKVNQINHIRGTLREYGITMPAGVEKFMALARASIEKIDCGYLKEHLLYLLDRTVDLEERIKHTEDHLEKILEENEQAKNLRTVPGIGLMTVAAILAVVDDVSRFKDAKSFASYLGLVPREHSSGDKRRMGSITRSGSEIVRRYLIHGARCILALSSRPTKYDSDPNISWAQNLKGRIGMNKATVALAHRMARTAFAILRENKPYEAKKPKRLKTIDLAS